MRQHRRTAIAATVGLTLCTFLLTRHTQISGFSALLAPVVLLTVLMGARFRADSALLFPTFLYLAVSLLLAMASGVEFAESLRFFAIISGVLLATQYDVGRAEPRWILLPVAIQAIAIAALSLALGASQDAELAAAARVFAVESEWGDVYTLNGWYFRVQVIGNALIPLSFMLAFTQWQRRRWHWIWAAIFGAGVAAAGNLTYAIVCIAFVAYKLFKGPVRIRFVLLGSITALCIAGFMADAIYDTISNKFGDSDSSMGIRFDQVDVLVEAAEKSPLGALFGHGIGARYPNGRERAYSESQYIELQILYFTYQIGIVGIVLLLGTLHLALRRRTTGEGRVLFWMYMACGASNPYILDSNQMVATMLLLTMFSLPRNMR